MTKTEIKEMAQDILLDGMSAHAGYVFEGERAEGLTEEEMVLITQVMKEQIVRVTKFFNLETTVEEVILG